VSLLPVGVTAVSGEFERGDLVACVDPTGLVIAQGLANYGAKDALALIGVSSSDVAQVLGFSVGPELVHRDNLVVLVEAAGEH